MFLILAVNLPYTVSDTSTLNMATTQDGFQRLHVARIKLVCSLFVEAFKSYPFRNLYLVLLLTLAILIVIVLLESMKGVGTWIKPLMVKTGQVSRCS